jgi:hypothetical protein
MKKFLLGLVLALSSLAMSQAQTTTNPYIGLTPDEAFALDSISVTKVPSPASMTNFPLPIYDPWPWEYQLPRYLH